MMMPRERGEAHHATSGDFMRRPDIEHRWVGWLGLLRQDPAGANIHGHQLHDDLQRDGGDLSGELRRAVAGWRQYGGDQQQ